MNIQRLLQVQKKLNDRILKEHDLVGEDLFHEQQLAFLVELAELANETRCFKYWSIKPSSERAVILEEYVDGLHFILTIGLTLGFTDWQVEKTYPYKESMTEQFLHVMECMHELSAKKTKESYLNVVATFFGLGHQLGFTYEEIEKSYLEKNKINHKRQDEGY